MPHELRKAGRLCRLRRRLQQTGATSQSRHGPLRKTQASHSSPISLCAAMLLHLTILSYTPPASGASGYTTLGKPHPTLFTQQQTRMEPPEEPKIVGLAHCFCCPVHGRAREQSSIWYRYLLCTFGLPSVPRPLALFLCARVRLVALSQGWKHRRRGIS